MSEDDAITSEYHGHGHQEAKGEQQLLRRPSCLIAKNGARESVRLQSQTAPKFEQGNRHDAVGEEPTEGYHEHRVTVTVNEGIVLVEDNQDESSRQRGSAEKEVKLTEACFVEASPLTDSPKSL